ncbi:MAG: MASE1 domain-containing protein [Gemmatimonadaceae bacterium]
MAARAGLMLDAVSGFASLVWAPTGIALAAVLLLGRRVWPGVFIGAFSANALTGAPVLAAVGIATGNTLEAVVGAYALRRAGFQHALDRLRDVLALILFAATLSTMVSATIGVASLYFAGMVAPRDIVETWRTWWVGDAIGAVLIAPLILVWATSPRLSVSSRRIGEAAGLIIGLVVASLLIYIVPITGNGERLGHAYVFFPLLMWAAIRFGQRGAVTATVLVSAIAVAGTVLGQGPFVQQTLHESLFDLQVFMGVTAATFLVLGASVSERERSKEELRVARDLARAANRAKADFLAVMSHELRTPLNAISGYAQLLELGVSGPLTEKQTDAIARIRSNQQHLLTLIDDVLSFAKIEAGSIPLKSQPVSVCEAIDSLDAVLRPDLLRQEVTLTWPGCDKTLAVKADPVKLRHVLLNVIGNAIKFTPPQGRIELSTLRSDDRVLIRVEDTGIGIPADLIGRVFEPFFQVQTGTTRQYPGVGLGLAIARDFARAMGGDITMKSTFGKGCVVTIELPIAARIDASDGHAPAFMPGEPR